MKLGKLDGDIRGLEVLRLEGTKGVGILLHSRSTHVLFRPVSERLCVLDVKLMSETVSIFSVFMPHAEYPDADVDVVYTQFDLEVARSKNRKPRSSLPVIGMRE